MSTDGLTVKSLMDLNKRTLAEVVMAQGNQVALLNKELALEQWQSGLLAAQRDEVLAFLARVEEDDCPPCWGKALEAIHRIMITDPRDGGDHGAQG